VSLDLTQFHAAFFEESFEALDGMEAALLKLSAGAADAELINTIFRVAHSIKGGSATFGFADVAAFTHVLETLLDQFRSGKRGVDDRIIDLLLQALDVMRDMLRATQHKQEPDRSRCQAVQADIERILATDPAAGNVPTASKPQSAGAAAQAAPATARSSGDAAAAVGWNIRFVPGTELLRHGNDPLRMFRELAALGSATLRVDAGKVPPLVDLDPEVCMLAWTIDLLSDCDRTAVEQVFDWAESDCTLQISSLAADVPAATQPATATPAAVAATVATPPAGPLPAAARAESTRAAASSESASIRVGIEKIDELLNSVGELVITQSVLSQLAASLAGPMAEQLRTVLAQLERHMRSLQESVMRVRMLPISHVFNRFPRMVRDLGQRLGKEIELKLVGEHTELDKTVLEKIGDPLVHLVRNSVDHGLELPGQRTAAGKAAHGTIELNAYHKGGSVIVEVSDDGAGLNRDKILAKARERGLVAATEELTEEKIYNLIFAPGFSTADVVSDVSGRGVGMDVVRRNINELGGHVQIVSAPGKGSTVRIRLPLTLAILDGQLARVGSEVYVVPIVSIVETVQAKAEHISSIANRAQLYRLRDEYLPVVRLHELFGVRPDHVDLLEGLLMIVEADGQRIALFVDELMSQQQVVIKSMESNFRQISGLAGATMLGDGRVAMILDVPGLIASFRARDKALASEPGALRAA